jgi:transcriptional regulator with XRE-family HTH domain
VDRAFEGYCADFGKRLRTLRLRAGLTQEDMMERGFSLRHYQRIEAGRSVTLQTLWKLAASFGVTPRELLPASGPAPMLSTTRAKIDKSRSRARDQRGRLAKR